MENCQLSAHSSPVPVFVSRLEDEAALYGLLIESFAENLDVNIPSCDDWMAGRLESRQFKTFCTWHHGRLSGFLNLSLEVGPEIRTVGVLP